MKRYQSLRREYPVGYVYAQEAYLQGLHSDSRVIEQTLLLFAGQKAYSIHWSDVARNQLNTIILDEQADASIRKLALSVALQHRIVSIDLNPRSYFAKQLLGLQDGGEFAAPVLIEKLEKEGERLSSRELSSWIQGLPMLSQDPATIHWLIEMASRDEAPQDFREASVDALGELASHAPTVLPTLAKLVVQGRNSLGFRAARSISRLYPSLETAIAALETTDLTVQERRIVVQQLQFHYASSR